MPHKSDKGMGMRFIMWLAIALTGTVLALITSNFVYASMSSLGVWGLILATMIHIMLGLLLYVIASEAERGITESLTVVMGRTVIILGVANVILTFLFAGVESVSSLQFVIALLLVLIPSAIADSAIASWVKSVAPGPGRFG